MMLIK